MKSPEQSAWLCSAAIVAVGFLGLLLSISAAGGGHGSYSIARAFFPYTMILGDLRGEIGHGARFVALLQYPAYSIAGCWAAGPHRRATLAWGLAALHLAAIVAAFAVRTDVFP
jgi:hypothetical protein